MKKSRMITIIAVIALVAITAATLVAGTFARYATTTMATATATTAAWTVSSGFGATKADTINLYSTIANAATTYPNLAANKIAPGTSGSFNIVVDGTGSETGIDYTITLGEDGQTLPTNLKFTIDDTDYTNIGTETDVKTGTIALADVGTPVTIPVTWNWAIGEDTDQDNGINNDEQAHDYDVTVAIRCEQHIGNITAPQQQ